jgi:xylulokinase
MEDLLLGIDVGTTGAKAALVDVCGNLQGVCQAEYPLFHVRPGWVEQNPEDWWQATCKAVRNVLAIVPLAPERILGLAVSSQGPTLLPLDRSGQPLRRAMIWMDRRAEAEALHLAKSLGTDEIHRITGNRPDAFFVAPRLLWMSVHERELFARTRMFVQINGYINYRLTDSFTLDHVHAALLQLRNYTTGDWSTPLCGLCRVEPLQFPSVVPGTHIGGEVSFRAATATGLRVGTPVMVGTVDSCAAALEAGVIGPGVAVEMAGTSTVFMFPNDQGLKEPALIAQPHVVPSIHLLLGAMVSSGASLQWFRDQFGHTKNPGTNKPNVEAFDVLTQQAAQVPARSEGIIFLPYMMGERSPLWHTNARGVFFGLSLASSRPALVRALLEGVAFALRHNMEIAVRAGAEIREVRSVGGCSRSTVWNQIKADVLGRPILLLRDGIGAPYGDAIIAGLGAGIYADIRKSLAQMVQVQRCFEPNKKTREQYDRFYKIFLKIYEHLKDDFDHLAEAMQSDYNKSCP